MTEPQSPTEPQRPTEPQSPTEPESQTGPAEAPETDDDYALDPALVAAVMAALDDQDRAAVREAIADLHRADRR
ncbi:MAG: hypothetical protein AAFV86_23200, partial [Pseudomonadota bacterium]